MISNRQFLWRAIFPVDTRTNWLAAPPRKRIILSRGLFPRALITSKRASPAPSAAAIFTLLNIRRHSEERCSRRRISSMPPHPAHHDEAAFDDTARATQYWMRFFASLRMTRQGGLPGGASLFGRGSGDGILQSPQKLVLHPVFKNLEGGNE
jgi:hypothetical protein